MFLWSNKQTAGDILIINIYIHSTLPTRDESSFALASLASSRRVNWVKIFHLARNWSIFLLTVTWYMAGSDVNALGWIIECPFEIDFRWICVNDTLDLSILLLRYAVHPGLVAVWSEQKEMLACVENVGMVRRMRHGHRIKVNNHCRQHYPELDLSRIVKVYWLSTRTCWI